MTNYTKLLTEAFAALNKYGVISSEDRVRVRLESYYESLEEDNYVSN